MGLETRDVWRKSADFVSLCRIQYKVFFITPSIVSLTLILLYSRNRVLMHYSRPLRDGRGRSHVIYVYIRYMARRE